MAQGRYKEVIMEKLTGKYHNTLYVMLSAILSANAEMTKTNPRDFVMYYGNEKFDAYNISPLGLSDVNVWRRSFNHTVELDGSLEPRMNAFITGRDDFLEKKALLSNMFDKLINDPTFWFQCPTLSTSGDGCAELFETLPKLIRKLEWDADAEDEVMSFISTIDLFITREKLLE